MKPMTPQNMNLETAVSKLIQLTDKRYITFISTDALRRVRNDVRFGLRKNKQLLKAALAELERLGATDNDGTLGENKIIKSLRAALE